MELHERVDGGEHERVWGERRANYWARLAWGSEANGSDAAGRLYQLKLRRAKNRDYRGCTFSRIMGVPETLSSKVTFLKRLQKRSQIAKSSLALQNPLLK